MKNDYPEKIGLAGDQPQAFDAIVAALLAGKLTVKLVGYAGTGKTFLLGKLATWAVRVGLKPIVCAPTHKACGVIAQKIPRGVEVRTIHSILGLRLEPDFENDTGGRICRKDADAKKPSARLIICDEASMVGSVLKSHIEALSGYQWLFVGDLAQLPPVGETASELLSNPDAELRQVLRQAEGSEILNLATRIRGGDMSLSIQGGLDVHQVEDAEALFQAAIERFKEPEYQQSSLHARMLVFRNSRRRALNERMRSLLVGSDDPWTPGEWLTMMAQFSPAKSKLALLAEQARQFEKGTTQSRRAWKSFFSAKDMIGSSVTSLHVSQDLMIDSVASAKVKFGADAWDVWKIVAKDGDEKHELPVLMKHEEDRYQETLNALIAEAAKLKKERDEQTYGSTIWQQHDDGRKSAWQRFFSLEETFADIDYCYCITTHKSQGSTFQHAFVDFADLARAGGMKQRIYYTAATRPAKTLSFYA